MLPLSHHLGSSTPLHWLLVSFDQWRGDWLEMPGLHLPTLNYLARRSFVAKRCLTASPQCVPARASWLTGLWPSALGLSRNDHFSLSPSSPSFVRNLQQEGWHTALIGKTHWHPHASGVDLRDQLGLLKELGFCEAKEIAGPRVLAELSCELTDVWEEYQPGLQARYRDDLQERYHGGNVWRVRPSMLPTHLYPDCWVGEQACDWLRRQGKSEQPWLLWVSFPGPHEPWDTPYPWAGRHNNISLPSPTPRPSWISRQSIDSECRRRELQWSNFPNNDEIASLRTDYADHLSLLDDQLKKLLHCLPEPHRTAITIVSDHGELLGDAGFLYKSCFLEGAIRSLAIHYRPDKLFRPIRSLKTVGLSWFLDAASQDVGELCAFNIRSSPRYVFSEFGDELLVSDRYRKLVLNRKGEPLWATDLKLDPAEQNNLIDMPVKLSGSWQSLFQAGQDHLGAL